MKDIILNTIKRFSLIEKGDTVTVAISGGADSVALLHALNSVKDELEINLNAAHLNHLIRGQEADADALFVKSFCEKLGIHLFYDSRDVPEYAKQEGKSLELAAREVRYEFLSRVACGKIATAHTASDNLETMIFNLSRGTSIKGLCGIPVKRENVIRPLIACTRADVEEYCRSNSLDYVTDSTNLSDDYSRNKIRHNVIPILKEINPLVEISALRTSESLQQDCDYLDAEAEKMLYKYIDNDGLYVEDFENISPSKAKRVVKRYFEICYPSVMLESKHINNIFKICCEKSGKINLPSNLFAIVSVGVLKFIDNEKSEVDFSVKIKKIKNVNNLFSINEIDCDKIVGNWVLRTRQEGDKIRLQNRGVTKTLKKIFTENKVERNLRSKIPVIADEQGIIWVYGVGVAERVAVNSSTKKILKVEVQKI